MALRPTIFSGQGLTPDITGGIARGQQLLQGENLLEQQQLQLQAQRRAEEQAQQQAQALPGQQATARELLERQARGEQIQTGADLAKLFVDNPQLAETVFNSAGALSEFQRNDLAEFGFQLEQLAQNPPAQQQLIEQRVMNLQRQGRDPRDTGALLAASPEQRQRFARTVQIAALSPKERLAVAGGGKQGLASAKTEILADGSVIQALPTGDVEVRNPSGQVVTGQARLDALQQAQEFKQTAAEREAELAVSKARRVASATQRERRVSEVKTELSTRNRNAARESVRLNQALKVAGTADQGLTGAVKLQLAKVLPNIDVSDEAVLDQTLKQLAVDQLQSFKGPTTDFEFGIVEQTTGTIGDPRTANIARLNSLKRANWFNKREFDQFNRHVKNGGDPDTFSFNFGEPVETKKGVFTLQDIQDTAVANNTSIEETLKRLNQ